MKLTWVNSDLNCGNRWCGTVQINYMEFEFSFNKFEWTTIISIIYHSSDWIRTRLEYLNLVSVSAISCHNIDYALTKDQVLEGCLMSMSMLRSTCGMWHVAKYSVGQLIKSLRMRKYANNPTRSDTVLDQVRQVRHCSKIQWNNKNIQLF